MNTTPTSPTALAETLLREWEAYARPALTPAYAAARAQLLRPLAEFAALLLLTDDINVDAEDARTVLRHATAFRLSTAISTGPGRATRLTPLLAAGLTSFPPTAPFTGLQPIAALLNLQSGPAHDLEMDELFEITETIQQNILTEETEMIFGHGTSSEPEDAGLLVWLLVGYVATLPAPTAV